MKTALLKSNLCIVFLLLLSNFAFSQTYISDDGEYLYAPVMATIGAVTTVVGVSTQLYQWWNEHPHAGNLDGNENFWNNFASDTLLQMRNMSSYNGLGSGHGDYEE
jgi:hypothetical protein